jgi:hypothetical protein
MLENVQRIQAFLAVLQSLTVRKNGTCKNWAKANQVFFLLPFPSVVNIINNDPFTPLSIELDLEQLNDERKTDFLDSHTVIYCRKKRRLITITGSAQNYNSSGSPARVSHPCMCIIICD